MPNFEPKKFWILLGILFVVNLLQAAFMPLLYDEAYYWYYSQNLSWGYFDHPPMMAYLIYLSGLVFKGGLGVRLVGSFLWILTLPLLWDMVEEKKKDSTLYLFFVLVLCMPLFHAYGFLTLPDTPLLFFTALFLWFYKKFIHQPSTLISLGIGLAMAGMMYSKYHGFLIILAVILSNYKLIFKPLSWLAVLFAVVLFSPHLYWLFENDFLTIQYHLFERRTRAYGFNLFTIGYFLNLIANFGLLFPFFFWALWKYKVRNDFDKALKVFAIGIIVFFFFSSFYTLSQAQWLISICIPMALLTIQYARERPNFLKRMLKIGVIVIPLTIYARLWLIHQPLMPIIHFETHGAKEWVSRLNEIVGQTPVVFENNYRYASFYSFYTGEHAISYGTIFARRNQFNIDDSELLLKGKKVALVSKYTDSGSFQVTPAYGQVHYGNYHDDYRTYNKLEFLVPDEYMDMNRKTQKVYLYNPYDEDISLLNFNYRLATFNRYKRFGDSYEIEFQEGFPLFIPSKDSLELTLLNKTDLDKDVRYLRFSASPKTISPGINSNLYPIK